MEFRAGVPIWANSLKWAWEFYPARRRFRRVEEPIVVSCRRGEGGQSARRVRGDPETRGLLRRTSLWREHRFARTTGESSFRSEACRPSRFPWRASAATGFSRDAAP